VNSRSLAIPLLIQVPKEIEVWPADRFEFICQIAQVAASECRHFHPIILFNSRERARSFSGEEKRPVSKNTFNVNHVSYHFLDAPFFGGVPLISGIRRK
jgi:hypothetical protein